jgi:hypothetical protein
MPITSYTDPQAFLSTSRAYLERNEAATALILGMSLRMASRSSPIWRWPSRRPASSWWR